MSLSISRRAHRIPSISHRELRVRAFPDDGGFRERDDDCDGAGRLDECHDPPDRNGPVPFIDSAFHCPVAVFHCIPCLSLFFRRLALPFTAVLLPPQLGRGRLDSRRHAGAACHVDNPDSN